MSFICLNSDCEIIDLSNRWFKQRSFLYGDGHFTTALVSNGEIELLSRHLARLEQASLQLRFNKIHWQKLQQFVMTLATTIDNGILKIQIDRGEGIRGYGNTVDISPTIFVWLTATNEFQNVLPKVVPRLEVVETRLSHNELLAGLKHTNRIEQAIIAAELESKNLADGLVLDVDGRLIETNKANVFWCEQGQWFTPNLECCGVNGTLRQEILSQVDNVIVTHKSGLKVIEAADALFLCNALIHMQPVAQIVNKQLNFDKQLDVDLAMQFISKITL